MGLWGPFINHTCAKHLLQSDNNVPDTNLNIEAKCMPIYCFMRGPIVDSLLYTSVLSVRCASRTIFPFLFLLHIWTTAERCSASAAAESLERRMRCTECVHLCTIKKLLTPPCIITPPQFLELIFYQVTKHNRASQARQLCRQLPLIFSRAERWASRRRWSFSEM